MPNTLFRAVAETPVVVPEPVPSGQYTSSLISYSVEHLPPWINFVFKINSGKHKNKKVGYSVKQELVIPIKISPEPTLFSISSALLGRKVELDEFIDLDDLLGLSCEVTVDEPRLYDTDVTVLSKVMPIKERNV